MPTLHGYRDIPLNLYDAFSPRNFTGGDIRLFGNLNVGNEILTNLQVAGQMGSDQLAVIGNWYARTNIDIASRNESFRRAWDAWTHATTVTAILGCSPITSLPLSDLLNRRQGQSLEVDTSAGDATEVFAKDLAAKSSTTPPQWETLRWAERQNWIAVAHEAQRIMGFQVLMTVPPRQCFSVRLMTDSTAWRALMEVMPTDVAPQALVWCHLEGYARRDIQ